MVERIKVNGSARERAEPTSGGNYFANEKTNIEFIPSGSKLLDLALGGGWAENRVANVIGDKSTGKTLLMIEACANFANKYPKGVIKYREAEAAFDKPYAAALGMPLDRVDFGDPIETVEDVFEDLTECVKSKHPTLYIVDSLDALSDRDEMARDMDKGSYGTGKAKQMSEMFRRVVRDVERSRTTFMIVSQVRDKINAAAFGKKWTRAGGRALDFYASQAVYLSQIDTVSAQRSGVKRAIGVTIRARVEKNKIGLPFREAQFDILFGYGIDDLQACVDWLEETKSLDLINVKATAAKDYLKHVRSMADEYHAEMRRLHSAVAARWYEIENEFMPTRRKYA